MTFKEYRDGKLDSDPNFDITKQIEPHDIEDQIFKMMLKGKTIETQDQAEAIVGRLNEVGLTTPSFPRHVWQVRAL